MNEPHILHLIALIRVISAVLGRGWRAVGGCLVAVLCQEVLRYWVPFDWLC